MSAPLPNDGPLGRFVSTSIGPCLRGIVVAWALIDPHGKTRDGRARGEALAIVLHDDGSVALCFHSGRWNDQFTRDHTQYGVNPAQAFDELRAKRDMIDRFDKLGRWNVADIRAGLESLWAAVQITNTLEANIS